MTAYFAQAYPLMLRIPRLHGTPALSLCEAAVLLEAVVNAIEALPYPGHIALVLYVRSASVAGMTDLCRSFAMQVNQHWRGNHWCLCVFPGG